MAQPMIFFKRSTMPSARPLGPRLCPGILLSSIPPPTATSPKSSVLLHLALSSSILIPSSFPCHHSSCFLATSSSCRSCSPSITCTIATHTTCTSRAMWCRRRTRQTMRKWWCIGGKQTGGWGAASMQGGAGGACGAGWQEVGSNCSSINCCTFVTAWTPGVLHV